MGIGRRIKSRREDLKLTQAELANKVGVTPSSITNYESDTSHPKEAILYKLFESLKCDANYLFQDEMKNYGGIDDPDKQRLINNYDKLNLVGRQKLVDYSADLVVNPANTEPFELVHTSTTK